MYMCKIFDTLTNTYYITCMYMHEMYWQVCVPPVLTHKVNTPEVSFVFVFGCLFVTQSLLPFIPTNDAHMHHGLS